MTRIGGIATQRERTPIPRKKLLRAYEGVIVDGALTIKPGAWVKEAGTDDERRWDSRQRANVNIGDTLVVLRDPEVAVRITGISSRAYVETLTTEPVVDDGPVRVMLARRRK